MESLKGHGRQAVFSRTTLLWLVLAVALALRLHGLNWDQGYGFHPDERSLYLRAGCMYDLLVWAPGYQDCLREYPQTQPGLPSLSVLLDPGRSPLNPHWFPLGSILIYVLVYARAIVELFADVSALDLRYVGRPLSALADVGSVYLVYLLGRRMYGPGVGLLAAAFTALAVVHIQNSHFYRPETFSAFFTLAAFWAMLRMVQRRGWRDSALLGLLVGLALAPKVNALPLVLPLGLAYAFRLRDSANAARPAPVLRFAGQTLAHASLAAAVALAAFFMTSPYALLDFRSFLNEQMVQTNMARHAGMWPFTVQYVGTPPFLYQMRQSIVWGLGIPLGVVAWAGIPFTAALAWRRRDTRRADLLLLAWVAPSLLLLESFQVRFLRYLFPVMPFMLLLGARMLLWLVERARDRANPLIQVPQSSTLGEMP
ncbi:MAG TPA: glycosyltransferase family 39 protein, partial [Dehalococcoidia bacterium]|nr:glycosyltransferase family 39 protein [Dehalococcoidia bacterium]